MTIDVSTLTTEEKNAVCTLIGAGPRLIRRYAEKEHIQFISIDGGANGMQFTGPAIQKAFNFLRSAGLIMTAMQIGINSSPSPIKVPGQDHYDVKPEAQELLQQLKTRV